MLFRSLERAVLLSGALEVRVQPGGSGGLIEVRRPDGTAVADAAVWAFGGGNVESLRTDLDGRAWTSSPIASVLARAGAAYGWRDLADPALPTPPPAPSGREPRPTEGGEAYDALFQGGPVMEVPANAL